MVEYGLLLTLVAMVAVASMKTIGSVIKNVFSTAASNILRPDEWAGKG
jgi:Flp pilus assembly pilin Flp